MNGSEGNTTLSCWVCRVKGGPSGGTAISEIQVDELQSRSTWKEINEQPVRDKWFPNEGDDVATFRYFYRKSLITSPTVRRE